MAEDDRRISHDELRAKHQKEIEVVLEKLKKSESDKEAYREKAEQAGRELNNHICREHELEKQNEKFLQIIENLSKR